MDHDDLNRWLKATEYNDVNSSLVQSTLKEILANAACGASGSDVDKAIAIYNYVPDEIKFGFDKKFYDYKASEVIRSKIGFCNPKSTLFVTLLRAAQIPARQHFVGINMKILDGAGDISRFTDYSDHVYTEVWLQERWIKVDGYVVDAGMYKNARKKMNDENSRAIGWGIHTDGTIEWNGKEDAFIQCVQNEKCREIINGDFGVYDDIKSFYESGKALGKRTIIFSIMFYLVCNDLNKRVNAVRDLK